jgi:hypothetical protein
MTRPAVALCRGSTVVIHRLSQNDHLSCMHGRQLSIHFQCLDSHVRFSLNKMDVNAPGYDKSDKK